MYDKREPTEQEFIDYFYNHVDKLRYKYDNFTEYIKELQKTDLRKVISHLYFEENLANRLSLIQSYISKRNKRVIREKTNKKEYYINIIRDRGNWSIDGRRKLRDTPKKALQEWAEHHLGICEA
jgi:hypothetical protein